MRQGTRREALLYSAGANARHGLKRTDSDKRRAVETLLNDREWSGWSSSEIARVCGVSKTFVLKVRARLQPDYADRPVLAVRGGQVYEMRPPAAAAARPSAPASGLGQAREVDTVADGRNYARDWLRHLLAFTPAQFERVKEILGGNYEVKVVAEAVASVMVEAVAE